MVYFQKSNNKEKLKISLTGSTYRENYLSHIHFRLIFVSIYATIHTFLKQTWNRMIMLGPGNIYSLLAMFPCRRATISVTLSLPPAEERIL